MSDEAKQYDLSPSLLRQRRNLMVVSLIILFMVIAGAKLDKVTFLGIQMTFENPKAIIWFLKIFLIYFLYRYYLYIIQEPDLFLKNTFYDRLRALTWQKIQIAKNEIYPQVKEYGGEYDFRKMKKAGIFKRNVNGVVGRDSSGGFIHGDFEINVLSFFWDGLRAFLYTLFNRSYVTDYFLPFIVAFAALASVARME
jgi:hypothetical protein